MSTPSARPSSMLPMRLVSARTGLSADVLRVWERRYKVVTPQRSPGGQRWYSETDVARLRLLARAIELGHSIGTVAHVPDAALAELVRSGEAERLVPPGNVAVQAHPHVADALAAVEALDGNALDATLRQAAIQLPLDLLLDGVIVPLIKTVGDRWHMGRLTPAHEHLATAVVRRLIGWLGEQYAPPADAPTLVVTTPAGQQHELGASLAALTATGAGWRVTYLGPNLPAEDIAVAVRATEARALALSVVHPSDDPLLAGELQRLRSALGALPIVVGGGAVDAYRPAVEAIQAAPVRDLASLRAWLAAHAGT